MKRDGVRRVLIYGYKGIVTSAGRASHFPLFLSSTTEQVLATSVRAGFGLEDDSRLSKVYLPQTPTLVLSQASTPPPPFTSSTSGLQTENLRLVKQVMTAVHLAAAAEALSLGKRVGLDMKMLYDIIAKAAGTSRMFVERGPGMLSGIWMGGKTVTDVVEELVSSPSLSACVFFFGEKGVLESGVKEEANKRDRVNRWRKRIGSSTHYISGGRHCSCSSWRS